MKHLVTAALMAWLPGVALAAPTAADIKASVKIERGENPCLDEDVARLALPRGAKVGGFVETTVRWKDAKGEFIAAFWMKDEIQDQTGCKIETRHLQVDIFEIKGGKAKPYRMAREVKGKPCYFDDKTNFDEPISVDDFNGNGIGELRFSYTTGCYEDGKPEKPITRKLMVLEGKAGKAIFRGVNAVKTGKTRTGGWFKEEGFKNDAVRVEASRAWAALLDD